MDQTNLGQRFVNGGEEELEEVIQFYGEKLLRYATAIICDYHEAENIVQEVFFAAYQNRATFDGSNLSAWLYKITYHRSLNQQKKRKILFYEAIHRVEDSQQSDQGLSDETLRALQKLKPKERAILYGRVIEENSYEELALLTGSSPATLRKRYERAKHKLAKYLHVEHSRRESSYGGV
ncbi:RNA polymerase sigma factor [Paenibacillus yanchengensis]|uniref:RNA polymerase sigma factor n=1 Tax=Paenibacillus yanchengensis TaxID=2035833 RepID=A0ABW4YQN1_9BACL